MSQKIYLDHNATTPLHPAVIKVMQKNMVHFGNPSSHHWAGQKSKALIETAREQIANAIQCPTEHILFVSSGTMANNTIIRHISDTAKSSSKPTHIICSQIEHPSVLMACERAEKAGLHVSKIPVNTDGIVDPKTVEASITKDTALISIMMANNETGSIQPISDINAIAQDHGIPMHCDAIQGVGKIPFSAQKVSCTYFTLSAHKIGGPKGIAAIITPDPDHLTPLLVGGPQEQERVAGTENTLGIIGFGEAMAQMDAEIKHRITHMTACKTALIQGLKTIPEARIYSPKNSLVNTINIAFKGVSGEGLSIRLDTEGLAISTGSACATGSTEHSHVLAAMGIEEHWAKSAIRLSIGPQTSINDCKSAAQTIQNAVQDIRALS